MKSKMLSTDSQVMYESHYTRHKSEKKYLAPELNINIMYNLYKESCSSDPVSLHIFRQVFNNKLNYASEHEKRQIKQE